MSHKVKKILIEMSAMEKIIKSEILNLWTKRDDIDGGQFLVLYRKLRQK